MDTIRELKGELLKHDKDEMISVGFLLFIIQKIEAERRAFCQERK